MILLPIGLQAFAMAWDEWYFHRKRGLGDWERWGHPLDTLSVIACIGTTVFSSANPHTIALYLGLAVFSCLCVTKDEWVHQTRCEPAEHWLHAVLFILHPVVLGVFAWIWIRQPHWHWILMVEFVLLILFAVYQTVYWNWVRADK